MTAFLTDDFLLQSPTARQLYHEHAAGQPIIDYHCHLPPDQIAQNRQFGNLMQVWLCGDHYKWRAMRANGVPERYVTGDASDWEKFEKWAETVPYTVRNPLYHWTHLELRRYFGITDLLDGRSARRIWEQANALLQTPDYAVHGLLRKMSVHVVCTADDPADTLEHHRALWAQKGLATQVLPTFRPDKAMTPEAPDCPQYPARLGAAAGLEISDYAGLLAALRQRHDYFARLGCRLSDHGLERVYAAPCTEAQAAAIFAKARTGQVLTEAETEQFKAAMLVELAVMDREKGWTQQFHLGALRNNNTRALRELGPDTGWDSIGDFQQVRALSRFLDTLDDQGKLAKNIPYNLNPADNDLLATMIGNFQDGLVAGKMQFGSGWWFLDQKDGMEKQLNSLSNMGLLSRFVGMLTDSRSFLSYPRHEYFRRILCNVLGGGVARGELPAETLPWLGELVERICHGNARAYFGFEPVTAPAALVAQLRVRQYKIRLPVDFLSYQLLYFRLPTSNMKVVTFGEVMMRLSPPPHQRLPQAASLDVTYGGGDANVAAALAWLGWEAAHVTAFPQSELGHAAAAHLRRFGVDTRHCHFTEGHRLGLYFLEVGASLRPSRIVYDRVGSAFAQLDPAAFNWDEILAGADWLHWTGITPAISLAAAQATQAAIAAAQRLGVRVSADVNYRRNLWQYGWRAQDVMPPLVAGCDLIVCTADDADDLFGIRAAGGFASMSEQLAARFPRLRQVIATRRQTHSASHERIGGLLWQEEQLYETPYYDIAPVVDRIGGGDSFIAGFLYGLARYDAPNQVLAFATVASALKHTVPGDINLITAAEVEHLMQGNLTGRLVR